MNTKEINERSVSRAGIQKPVKVPMNLSTTTNQAAVKVTNPDSKVEEPVVVLIANGHLHAQLTICRPIKPHRLESTAWCAFPVQEMQTTLASTVDPMKASKEKALEKNFQQFLVETGVYKPDPGDPTNTKVVLLDSSEVSLNAIRSQQKVDYERAKKEAHLEYLSKCATDKIQPKPDWKFGKTLETFGDERYKETLRAQRKKWRTEREEEIKKIDPPFYTRTGPETNREQVALVASKNYTHDQIVGGIRRTLTRALDGTTTFDVDPPEVKAAFIKAGDDPKALKDFIFKYAFPFLQPAKVVESDTYEDT